MTQGYHVEVNDQGQELYYQKGKLLLPEMAGCYTKVIQQDDNILVLEAGGGRHYYKNGEIMRIEWDDGTISRFENGKLRWI